jgi:hypothetical protein
MVAQHLASTADVDGASEMVRSAVRRIMQVENMISLDLL